VYWDDIKKASHHSFSLLNILSKGTLEDNDLVIYTTDIYYIGGQKELDAYLNKNNKNTIKKIISATTSTEPSFCFAPVAAGHPEEVNPNSCPATQQATSAEDETVEEVVEVEEEDDIDETNDRFDPQATIQDILEEEKSGRFIEQQQQYEREKLALINNQIETGPKKGPKLTWTVTNDIKKMKYQPKPNSIPLELKILIFEIILSCVQMVRISVLTSLTS
jgi:hypothetical protein